MKRIVRCYAESDGGRWEALCLDLDLAVQGDSFPKVFEDLRVAIHEYMQHVLTLPEADQRRLLHRKVPLAMRLKYRCLWLLGALCGPSRSKPDARAEFSLAAA